MKNHSARFITFTAVLLALCVVVQQFKTVSQYITGPIVNAILIIAALAVGVWSGIAVGVLSAVFAWLINPAPVMQMVPQMVPLVALGNVVIVLLVYAFRNKQLIVGMVLGSLAKFAVLTAGVLWVIIPLFTANVPDQVKAAMTAMFSYNQLITALIGSVIAYLLWWRLKKIPMFQQQSR